MSFAARPQNTSSFTINSGGQLTLIAGGSFTFGTGPFNLNGTGPSGGPQAGFRGAMRNDRGIAPIVINNAAVLQSDTLIHVEANNGTGATDTPGATNTFTGPISGPGRLTFTAPNSDIEQGFLVLAGPNTYSGGTLVNGGILVASGASATFGTGEVTVNNAASPDSIARIRIESGVLDAIADTATLSLVGGGTPGVADQGFAQLGDGVNEIVGGLMLGLVTQGPGTYGSTSSTATFQNDEYFTGTGIVTVRPTLTITLSAPNVILSWPTNADGFLLQGVGAVGGTWTDNTTPFVILDTNYTVTELAPTNKFFRLKK
jgi:fibronectin-binding autotransporter adhesin